MGLGVFDFGILVIISLLAWGRYQSLAGHVAAGQGTQIGANLLQRLWADAADAPQVVIVGEGASRFTGLDDPMGQGLADARQLHQFRPVGGVDVDLESGHQRFRPIDLDQLAPPAAVGEPPSAHRGQRNKYQRRHGRLVGPAQKPTGLTRGMRHRRLLSLISRGLSRGGDGGGKSNALWRLEAADV